MNRVTVSLLKAFSFMVALLMATSPALAKKTLYQCAVDKVESEDGARVNIIEHKGKLRANLIFGTTVSGTMYTVTETAEGFSGTIKRNPFFKILVKISEEPAQNANIDGYASSLEAIYPTALSPEGFKELKINFVCGKKLPGRWK